jgi:ubiquinone/menaquinone biosynthesis C-methylase UbiE
MDVVRQAYEGMAEQYIALFGSSAQVHPDDLALITRHLSIRPGAVLDVGCGPGHLTEHLRRLDVDASGIDMVPQFINHARIAYPSGRFELGSIHQLPTPDGSIAGILAWYSLIHVPPNDLDSVLVELRRVATSGAKLVVGFFEGDEVEAFEHAVTTAYYWPVDEFSARLRRAGFVEIERQRRPGMREAGRRPHAAVVAVAY